MGNFSNNALVCATKKQQARVLLPATSPKIMSCVGKKQDTK